MILDAGTVDSGDSAGDGLLLNLFLVRDSTVALTEHGIFLWLLGKPVPTHHIGLEKLLSL